MSVFSNKITQLAQTQTTRAWIPSDATTLYQWYDASSSSYYTLSGSTVTAMTDRSGNGLNLTGTGSITRTAGGLNSLDIINMNNTSANQYFEKTSLSITGNTMTVFTVNKNTVGSGRVIYGRVATFSRVGFQDYNDANAIAAQLYGTTAGKTSLFYNSADRAAVTASTNGSAWNLVMSQRNGTSAQISNNGGTPVTGTGLGTTNFNITRFRTGNDFSTADSGMNGSIAEIIIYTTALSTDDIDKCVGYLAWKWGLTGNLPAGHPYKSAAPTVVSGGGSPYGAVTTASTNVFLLDSLTNSTYSDLGGNALTITKTGTVNYSSTIPFAYSDLASANFGTGSGYLSPAQNTLFAFGTGDWTVECMLYLTARPTSSGLTPLFDSETGGNGARSSSVIIYLTSTGVLEVYQNGAARGTSGANTIPLNTWKHIAVARNGSTTTIYFDGVSVGSTTYAWSSMTLQGGYIGLVQNVGSATSQYGISGLVNNFRVTKGRAVYTANFPNPTTDLTNY